MIPCLFNARDLGRIRYGATDKSLSVFAMQSIKTAAEFVKPFAVDASSLLEESPGVKSSEKMKLFFNELRRGS